MNSKNDMCTKLWTGVFEDKILLKHMNESDVDITVMSTKPMRKQTRIENSITDRTRPAMRSGSSPWC